MQNQPLEDSPLETIQQDAPAEPAPHSPRWGRLREKVGNYWALFIIAFLLGLGGGFMLGNSDLAARYENEAEGSVPAPQDASITAQLIEQINPPEGYQLEAKLGDIGPQLLAAGAVDYNAFIDVYERSGQPLSEDQLAILTEGSDADVVFDRENAYFLLNFFWALGLANENPILTDGPMVVLT